MPEPYELCDIDRRIVDMLVRQQRLQRTEKGVRHAVRMLVVAIRRQHPS